MSSFLIPIMLYLKATKTFQHSSKKKVYFYYSKNIELSSFLFMIITLFKGFYNILLSLFSSKNVTLFECLFLILYIDIIIHKYI